MNTIDKNREWIQAFNRQVEHIELEFDAFLLPGPLQDYYSLRQDDSTGTLTLDLCSDKELPKQIADALQQAFMNTKPTIDPSSPKNIQP